MLPWRPSMKGWPMKKPDKALREVWGWKDKVYRKYSHLSPEEYLQKIKDNAEKLLSTKKIKLKEVSSEKNHRKIA